jgi:DNA-binding NarL/FixJ family response regulator
MGRLRSFGRRPVVEQPAGGTEGIVVTAHPDQPAQRRDLRVLVVDDHPMVRTALTATFEDEDGLTVVGECADGSEVVEAAARLRPDVICMDMSMPTMNGVAATEALRAARSDALIVMLTASPAHRSAVAAAGADALVPKSARGDALLRCLRAVAGEGGDCPYCL